MTNRLFVAPVEYPVSLQEIRDQMGITQVDDQERDIVITPRIRAATQWAEKITNTAFVEQTWIKHIDCFNRFVDLKGPLRSVASIKYIDKDGVYVELDPANYLADTVGATLHPAYGRSWPRVRQQVNSIRIEYVCGFGLAVDVPDDIKEAIKFIVSHWENYQSSIEGFRVGTIPYAVTQLLQDYKDMRNIF